MTPPPPEIIQQIKDELTQELWKRLVLHAEILVKNHSWHGVLGGPPLKGNAAEDYANEAVLRTLNGRRAWKPENCSLRQHLKGAIDSIINHESEKGENTSTSREDALSDGEHLGSPFDTFSAENEDYEEIEFERIQEDLILEFLECLEDDLPVQRIFEALHDGIIKRADIAAHLKITVNDLDRLRKRLGTRVHAFKEEKTKTRKEAPNA